MLVGCVACDRPKAISGTNWKRGIKMRYTGLSDHVRGLAVVVLLLAALAASIAVPASAAPWPRESNQVVEPLRWADDARDVTKRWIDRSAVHLHTAATRLQDAYLLNWDDMWVASNGLVVVNSTLWPACTKYGCCSSTWYWSTAYPGWIFQFCSYDRSAWLNWRRF